MNQFIRFESFSNTKTNTKSGQWTASDSAAETMRHDGHYSPDIQRTDQNAPKILFGVDPCIAVEQFNALNPCVKNSAGNIRKMPKNHHYMLEIVPSFPHSIKECEKDLDKAGLLQAWTTVTIDFYRQKYGDDQLKSAVLHTDEGNPHLHLTVLPRLDGDSCFDFKSLHLAKKMESESPSRRKKKAYQKGLSIMLDEYHEAVGSKFGMSRESENKRKRKARAEIVIDKKAKEIAKDYARKIDAIRKKEMKKRIGEYRRENQNMRENFERIQSKSRRLIDDLKSEIEALDQDVHEQRVIAREATFKLDRRMGAIQEEADKQVAAANKYAAQIAAQATQKLAAFENLIRRLCDHILRETGYRFNVERLLKNPAEMADRNAPRSGPSGEPNRGL